QEWVLAICYAEKSSRGIAALRADISAPCCSRCACGGSSSCGCGCHPAGNGNGQGQKTTTSPQNKKRALQCEPTLTCETYKFKVYRYQRKTRETNRGDDFKSQIAYVSERLPQPPSENAELQAWSIYTNNYRDTVGEFLSDTFCAGQEDA